MTVKPGRSRLLGYFNTAPLALGRPSFSPAEVERPAAARVLQAAGLKFEEMLMEDLVDVAGRSWDDSDRPCADAAMEKPLQP
jgi:hypothetical protein